MPPAITPLVNGSTLAGEGQWTPAGRLVDGAPAVFTTTLRAASGAGPVGLARIDTTKAKVVVFAGTTEPGGTWSAQGAVPPAEQASLLAAFNGGFQFSTANGGFYSDGRQSPALRDGAASLVVHVDGTAEVDDWGRDATLTPDIAQVRQNLSLLVDAGAATAQAASPWLWGATFGNVAATWRSAVGSDANHNLYFAGGPGVRPADLAAVLIAAGAIRAMELDINPQWVFFSTYSDAAGGGTVGAKLLPNMNYSPEHVLTPFWRDFVGVFGKAAASGAPAATGAAAATGATAPSGATAPTTTMIGAPA